MNRDPRFATLDARVENIDQVDAAVQAWIGAHDGAEAVKVLGEAGVPASLI
jgi:crotonobetainyl-CoA:carnitine CoA-transferase CaiB-like acyl-CoA transferase